MCARDDMSDPIREALAQLLAEHPSEVAANWYGCSSCQVSLGDSASYAAHLAEMILARWTLADGLAVGYIVRRPDDQDGIVVDDAGEEMFEVWCYDRHATAEAARQELVSAQTFSPGDPWKIYALTEIGEEQ